MKVAVFVIATLAVVLATPVKRQTSPANFAYQLPDGAELIVGQLRTGFSCIGRIYGYYADVDNGCRVFHVCLPILDETNAVLDTAHYSFMCGNTTLFDQQNLVCTHEGEFDCGSATGLYDVVNQNFGRLP